MTPSHVVLVVVKVVHIIKFFFFFFFFTRMVSLWWENDKTKVLPKREFLEAVFFLLFSPSFKFFFEVLSVGVLPHVPHK